VVVDAAAVTVATLLVVEAGGVSGAALSVEQLPVPAATATTSSAIGARRRRDPTPLLSVFESLWSISRVGGSVS